MVAPTSPGALGMFSRLKLVIAPAASVVVTNNSSAADYGNDLQSASGSTGSSNTGTVLGTGCIATGQTAAMALTSAGFLQRPPSPCGDNHSTDVGVRFDYDPRHSAPRSLATNGASAKSQCRKSRTSRCRTLTRLSKHAALSPRH